MFWGSACMLKIGAGTWCVAIMSSDLPTKKYSSPEKQPTTASSWLKTDALLGRQVSALDGPELNALDPHDHELLDAFGREIQRLRASAFAARAKRLTRPVVHRDAVLVVVADGHQATAVRIELQEGHAAAVEAAEMRLGSHVRRVPDVDAGTAAFVAGRN
eukprot:scaffold576_cov260-Pinguiococcus_pyrenoidosus.AAC.44